MIGQSVLVVEDDHGLRDVLARGLRAEEFTVITAADGTGALRAATPGLGAVVLDIGLPDADGRDVCQALRARGIDAPVIFLTARHQIDDRLSGFASGGDDYLTKPFAFSELIARLRVALRRSGTTESAAIDELVIDPIEHTLRLGSQRANVTPIEFRLLAKLIANPGVAVRRRQLIEAGWPVGAVVAPNTLDQYVRKIRRRMREIGAELQIQVVRGVGYRLVRPEPPDASEISEA